MKIIKPSVELIDDVNAHDIYCKIERCGRVCYQSESKGKPEEFIRMLIKRGHESVLEHVSLTFHIICDRAIMSELTRHRLASFSVESTRYVDHQEIKIIQLTQIIAGKVGGIEWLQCMETVADAYDVLRMMSVPPEDARAVLPLCLKSELYMTANLREWRHILKLRTSKHAHPQMKFVARQILDIFRDKLPVIVEDIK